MQVYELLQSQPTLVSYIPSVTKMKLAIINQHLQSLIAFQHRFPSQIWRRGRACTLQAPKASCNKQVLMTFCSKSVGIALILGRKKNSNRERSIFKGPKANSLKEEELKGSPPFPIL